MDLLVLGDPLVPREIPVKMEQQGSTGRKVLAVSLDRQDNPVQTVSQVLMVEMAVVGHAAV